MINVGPSFGSTVLVPIVFLPFILFFLWLAFTGEPAALGVVAIFGFVIAYLATVRLVLADGTLTMHRLFVRWWSVPISKGRIEILEGSGWPQFCVHFEDKRWCVNMGELNLTQLSVLLTALEQNQSAGSESAR